MRGLGEALDVEHRQRRVGDRLAEDALGVGAERRLELLVGAVRIDERALEPHAAHRVQKQVERAAVDGGARDHMVAAAGDIEHREEVGSLARRGQHARRTALERGDLGRHGIVGGVLQAGVEVAGLLQVEQAPHVLGRVVFPRGGLVDGHLARATVLGLVAALHADGIDGLGHGCAP